MNYLLLSSLHNNYVSKPGPYQEKCRDIYTNLRKNVIDNMFKVRSFVGDGERWKGTSKRARGRWRGTRRSEGETINLILQTELRSYGLHLGAVQPQQWRRTALSPFHWMVFSCCSHHGGIILKLLFTCMPS